MQEFNEKNYKTRNSIILGTLFICLTIFLFWIYTQTKLTTFLIIGILFTLIIFFYLIYALTSKIILTENEIIIKSAFLIRKLKYNEIKTMGVYVVSNYSVSVLNPEKYNQKIDGEKFIYLSQTLNFKPYSLRWPKEFIDFQYKEEIYEAIERRIKAST